LPSFSLVLLSGMAWVASPMILVLLLGKALEPLLGLCIGIAGGLTMLLVLVQVNGWVAVSCVLVITLFAASCSSSNLAFFWALLATGFSMMNAMPRLCGPWPALFEFQCRTYAKYHAASELRGKLDTVKPGKTLFACHPHGVLSLGWVSNVVWSRAFHNAAGRCFYLIDKTLRKKGLVAKFLCDAFEGPHGGIRDNSPSTLKALMERGDSVCMLPGAFHEASCFAFGRDRVKLSTRLGFVKYCLRHGYRLQPVYTFGESETYHTLTGFESWRFWLNQRGIPTVAFWGLWWCPLLPRRHCSLLTYVGEPIQLPLIEAPTDAQVQDWHAEYCRALTALFDEYKAEAGRPDAVLEIL